MVKSACPPMCAFRKNQRYIWLNVTNLTEEEYKEWVAKNKANQPKPETGHH